MTKDFVAINLTNSNSYVPGTRFFCSLCNRNLTPINNDKEEYVCTHCNISYYPKREKVKRANKFDTPGGRDRIPLVSMVDDNGSTEPSAVYKQPKLPRSFEMLKRPGVNLLNYTTNEE